MFPLDNVTSPKGMGPIVENHSLTVSSSQTLLLVALFPKTRDGFSSRRNEVHRVCIIFLCHADFEDDSNLVSTISPPPFRLAEKPGPMQGTAPRLGLPHFAANSCNLVVFTVDIIEKVVASLVLSITPGLLDEPSVDEAGVDQGLDAIF